MHPGDVGGAPVERHRQHRAYDRDNRCEAEPRQRKGKIGAEHDKGALRKIDNARAFINQHDADCDQRVNAAHRNARDSELQIERHGSPK